MGANSNDNKKRPGSERPAPIQQRWSRRDFLQTGLAGTAGLLSAAPADASGASPSAITWDAEVDVVVCGSGAAGSAAAMAAAHAGASGMVLEKSAAWGGTSAKSGFHIWIPNNHAMNKLGLKDEKGACLEYMAEHSYPQLFDPDSKTLGLPEPVYGLLETFYDEGAITVNKLAQWGVSEFDVANLGYDHIMSVDYNENSPYNKATVGRSMHPVDRDSVPRGGAYMVNQFRNRLLEQNVELRLRHRALRLHLNHKQQVIGLQASDQNGKTINIRTRRGVVFGSGCYSHNKRYVDQFQMNPVMGSCAAPTNEGDFIAIAGNAGAQMGNLSGAWRAQMVLEDTVKHIATPNAVFWPIGDSMLLVNKYGRRCVNEKRNYNDRTKALYGYDANRAEFPNLITFMVYDKRCADLYGGRYPIPPTPDALNHVAQGETLAALAKELERRLAKYSAHTGNLKLDPGFTAQFEATVKRFNEMAINGVDKDFSRGAFEYDKAWHAMQKPLPDARWPEAVNPDNATMHPFQDVGPYYAIILLPGCIGTNGGPVINRYAQVMNHSDQPIAGLYGAGNCIASPAANAYWGAGATIGPALVFGRIAGERVANEPVKELS